MERVISFLKSTKWISRILFFLWIIFSIFAKFPDETRLQIIIGFGAFFMSPAVLIETFTNPALKKGSDENFDSTDVPAKKAHRKFFLPVRWLCVAVLPIWSYCTFFSGFSKSEGLLSAGIIYGVLFFLPIITTEILMQLIRKASERKSDTVKSDKYISLRRISGLAALVFAVIFVILGIAANADPDTYHPNNMYPGYTLGAIGIILIFLSAKDPKTRTEYEERKKAKRALQEEQRERAEYEKRMSAYRGVYLTEQQIRNLEARIELPVIDDTSVFLGNGEVAVYYCAATRRETKTRMVGRTGGYSGGTVRIAKGLSIHTGSSSSHPIYDDVDTHYDGELVLTNRRVIFISDQKGFEVAYSSITAGSYHSDGITIQKGSHTYSLLLPKANLAVLAFNAAMSGELPIAKRAEYETDADDSYKYDEGSREQEESLNRAVGQYIEKGEMTQMCSKKAADSVAKPRKAMKTWAIICFVFAGIYALMAFGVESTMFGMTAFLCVLGIMFIALYKSPKSTPYLFGKSSGMKKNTFVTVCIISAFCSFGFISEATDIPANEGSTETADSSAASSAISETPSISSSTGYTETTDSSAENLAPKKVTSISKFGKTEHAMLVAENIEFSVELKPKDLSAQDIDIEISNATVLSVSDIEFTTEGKKTILTFKCTAIAEGETTLVVKSKVGSKTSNIVTFTAAIPPIITNIGRFDSSYVIQEVGDRREFTVYMKPMNLSQDDFVIEISDESIINITNFELTNENDQTLLTFETIGVGAGKATMKIKGADGKTESTALQFTVNEKDTSRTVYVTPTGKKYHYSAACAGKNAIATTQNKAIKSGKGRCGTCG